MYAGFLGALLQGGLLGRLVKRYGEFKLSVFAFVASVIAYGTVGFATSVAFLIIATTINAFGQGILRPVLTARLTHAVGRHEQGVALGIAGSLGSVAMALAPPTGGVMLDRLWLFAWAMVPTAVSALGLIATLAWAGVTERAAGTKPEPELHSGA